MEGYVDLGVGFVWSVELKFISLRRVSKKQSKLFWAYRCQIFTNFDNFWYKDGQDNVIM